MSNDDVGQDGGEEQTHIKDVLERAAADPEFAKRLLADPEAALAGYHLTEVQLLLLRSLDADDLAKLTPENLNLDEHFAVDSAVYTPEDPRMVAQEYDVYDREEIDG